MRRLPFRAAAAAAVAPLVLAGLAAPAAAVVRGKAPVITSVSRHVVPSGQTSDIVLHGRGFVGPPTVTIGGIDQQILPPATSTRLKIALAPHDAATVRIVVHTPAGSASRRLIFQPLPTLTSVDRAEGPAGGGTTVTIHGTHLDHATAVAFGSRAATRFRVTDSRTIVAVTPAHPAGLVSVHVTTQVGPAPITDDATYRYGSADHVQWSAGDPVDPSRGDPSAISCPTPTFCALVDGSGGLVTFDGTTWTDVTPATVDTWDAVYCWSAQLCFADSRGSVSTYDGTTWTTPVPTFGAAPAAITCWSASGCRAFDVLGHEFRYDGAGWHRTGHTITGVVSLTCTAASACTALTEHGAGYTLSGGSWSTGPGLPVSVLVEAAACAPDHTCLATVDDSARSVYRFTGTRWRHTAPLGLDEQALTCATETFCVVMTPAGGASVFDGTSWSAPVPVVPDSPLGPVLSCASASSCVVVGHDGTAVAFDGTATGQTWPADPLRGRLVQVSCPTSTWCMAIDAYGNWIEDVDGAWSAPSVGRGRRRAVVQLAGLLPVPRHARERVERHDVVRDR